MISNMARLETYPIYVKHITTNKPIYHYMYSIGMSNTNSNQMGDGQIVITENEFRYSANSKEGLQSLLSKIDKFEEDLKNGSYDPKWLHKIMLAELARSEIKNKIEDES